MPERWVKCTREQDGVTMWLNMAQAYAIDTAPAGDKGKRRCTRVFARTGSGLSCDTLGEPVEHFLPPAPPWVVPAGTVTPMKPKGK